MKVENLILRARRDEIPAASVMLEQIGGDVDETAALLVGLRSMAVQSDEQGSIMAIICALEYGRLLGYYYAKQMYDCLLETKNVSEHGDPT